MGWIGMRGSDKYDGQIPLWGIEVRSIPSESSTKTNRNLLDGLQYSMNTRDYGISKEQMAEWLDHQKPITGTSISGAITGSWYNKLWSDLFRIAPADLQAKLNSPTGENLRKILQDSGTSNRELKMLVFDWSNDPLFWKNPKLLEKIRRQQLRAIDRVEKGKGDMNEIMSDFLINSGLYAETLKSVGVKLDKKPSSPP
jgi:hypothetical protein